MRMWMVPPETMCRAHLLGEHRELHSLVGMAYRALDKRSTPEQRQRHLNGLHAYAEYGVVDTTLIQERHVALVTEMLDRGYEHHSPMRFRDYLGIGQGVINPVREMDVIQQRCADCRALYRKVHGHDYRLTGLWQDRRVVLDRHEELALKRVGLDRRIYSRQLATGLSDEQSISMYLVFFDGKSIINVQTVAASLQQATTVDAVHEYEYRATSVEQVEAASDIVIVSTVTRVQHTRMTDTLVWVEHFNP